MTDNECFFVKGIECPKGNDKCIYVWNNLKGYKRDDGDVLCCDDFEKKVLI